MKRFAVALIPLILLTFSLSSFPETLEAKSRKHQKSSRIKKKRKMKRYSQNPSQKVRSLKTGGVALRTGLMFGGVSGNGADGFINLGNRFQLGLFYGKGSVGLKTEGGSSSGTLEADIDMKLIQGRYFLGNSFFVGAGLGKRNFNLQSVFSGDIGSATMNAKFDTNVGHLMIGNLWSFRNGFFIGCDWVSYTMPFSFKEKEASVETDGDLGMIKNEMDKLNKDTINTLGKLSSTNVLVAYLGWMF